MAEIPLTIQDAALALRAGSITSVELTRALLERADRLNPEITVYITRMDESALKAAEQADAAFAIGFDEVAVFKAGDAYQQRTNWHLQLPPVLRDEVLAVRGRL